MFTVPHKFEYLIPLNTAHSVSIIEIYSKYVYYGGFDSLWQA